MKGSRARHVSVARVGKRSRVLLLGDTCFCKLCEGSGSGDGCEEAGARRGTCRTVFMLLRAWLVLRHGL